MGTLLAGQILTNIIFYVAVQWSQTFCNGWAHDGTSLIKLNILPVLHYHPGRLIQVIWVDLDSCSFCSNFLVEWTEPIL